MEEVVVLKPQDNTHTGDQKKIMAVGGGIVVLLLLLVGLLVTWEKTREQKKVPVQNPLSSPTTPPTNPFGITEQKPVNEQERINQWLVKNNLNQYGDPIGTVYQNGSQSPFGNTMQTNPAESGKQWYMVITARFPDKPWNKE